MRIVLQRIFPVTLYLSPLPLPCALALWRTGRGGIRGAFCEGGGMREYSDATLVDDLRELAQALIDDPETGPIIQFAATHGGRTHPWDGNQEAEYYPNVEDKILDAFFERQPVIRRCMAPPRGQSRSANADYASFENRIIALGAAGGISSGRYKSLDDPELVAEIRRRVMLCDDDIIWGDDERFGWGEAYNWNYRWFYDCCDDWISGDVCREDYDRWKANVALNGEHLERDNYLKIQRAYNMYAYKSDRFNGKPATPMFYLIPAYVWDHGLIVSRWQEGDPMLFNEFVALIKEEQLDFGIVYGDSGFSGFLGEQ